MGERTSRPAEVVVRVAPASAGTSAAEKDCEGRERARVEGRASARPPLFDALVYTTLALPGGGPVCGLPEETPRELCGLPLAAVEKVAVDWDNYRKYVSTFIRGEKAASALLSRGEIFKEVSPGLVSLLKGKAEPEGPLRVWWSTATPRAADLPWELLAYDAEGYADGVVSFVRGVPPDRPVPKLPVGEKLRLAFIHEPTTTPHALDEALRGVEGVELIDMTGHPLDALREAIRLNYELVHLVADGSTSLAHEGFLYLQCPDEGGGMSPTANRLRRWFLRSARGVLQTLAPVLPKQWVESGREKLDTKLNTETLSAAQLSVLQRGSQLAVLSLSPPDTDDASASRLDGMFLPGVFSSFVCIGSSALPMPNIVAQTGAGEAEGLGKFWRQFYADLGAGLEVERSVRAGLRGNAPQAVSLFLRQNYRQTFKRQAAQPAESVTIINAELQQSKEALAQLEGLEGSGLGEIVAAFKQRLSVRQQELQEKLDPWLEDQPGAEAGAGGAAARETKGAVTEQ